MVPVKQLAYENANSACQAAIRPWKGKATLNDYIKLCADIGPSYVQGIALAAALQGKPMKDILFQQQKRKRQRVSGPPGSCFGCGQFGHRIKNCPQKQQQGGTGVKGGGNKKEPGLCPRCKRGKHWANECKSKKDAQGNALTPLQGKLLRGQ